MAEPGVVWDVEDEEWDDRDAYVQHGLRVLLGERFPT